MKPNNCNLDMWSLDAEGYDRPTCLIISTSVHHFTWWQANCVHGSDGSLSHITNHNTVHSVCNASYSVWDVPFKAVYSRVVYLQDVHCFIYPWCRTTDISDTNGVMKEGCGQKNGMKLSSLKSHASVCNAMMVAFWVLRHHRERMLNSCIMYRHIGPALGVMVWSGIGYHSRTPLVHIAGNLNGQCYISEVLEPIFLSYLQSLPTAIF